MEARVVVLEEVAKDMKETLPHLERRLNNGFKRMEAGFKEARQASHRLLTSYVADVGGLFAMIAYGFKRF